MKASTTRILLFSGLLVPVVFWISTLIAAMLHGNYSHIKDTISELGAIGTRSEIFMATFTWICTALSIAFLMGMVAVCRQFNLNKLPLIGIVGFSIMFAWAAVFPSGNPMHPKAGPVLLLLLAGPLLAAVFWKGKQFKKLRMFSILSFIIMLLILIRAIPSATIQNNYTGLIQRFVHFGWSVWFVSLSLTFLVFIRGRYDQPD